MFIPPVPSECAVTEWRDHVACSIQTCDWKLGFTSAYVIDIDFYSPFLGASNYNDQRSEAPKISKIGKHDCSQVCVIVAWKI